MTTTNDALSDQLLALIADYFDVPVAQLTPATTFESLNVDSMDFIEMVFLVEERVGVSLDGALEDLRGRIVCVGDIIEFAREEALKRDSIGTAVNARDSSDDSRAS
ncbi:acyl carrier protein [Dyella flava]|uniref:Acyl carrier protein n=1 Tax=Dyella flava TaxID=1920170 RepID=A0ABS2K1E7_9GAMM|nr:acyl carrier protein [Dyella flava]MBM7124435.1 acyl carrier protein [Dyella flava]GLQ51904.1 hypothetical protein GCM10010872_33530 [Dyella flava]